MSKPSNRTAVLKKILAEVSREVPDLNAVRALLAAELAAKPAARAGRLHKYADCFAAHDAHCYCVTCHPEGSLVAAEVAARDALIGAKKKRKATLATVADKESHAPDRSAEIGRLSICACTHLATVHEEDELGSLLNCGQCALVGKVCDHFHYPAAAEAA